MPIFRRLLAAVLLSGVALTAHADPQPTLAVQGQVMVSGALGEFVPATGGQAVAIGQSLLVGIGSTAAVTHPNGAVAMYASGVHTVGPPGPAVGVALGSLPSSIFDMEWYAMDTVSLVTVGFTVGAFAGFLDRVVIDTDLSNRGPCGSFGVDCPVSN